MSDKEKIELLENKILELRKELEVIKVKVFEDENIWKEAIDKFGIGIAG
mgnify:CR=1 FL=1|tara:strand:+ start:351 stop:497 length:147 start_codon:yes stop_codon:yes gene_type:complete